MPFYLRFANRAELPLNATSSIHAAPGTINDHKNTRDNPENKQAYT